MANMKKTHPALVILLTALILGMLFFAMLYTASLLTGKRTDHRMPPVIAGDKIALVKIEGLIATSEKIIEELGDYTDDSSIKAIVIRVDSPGGGVVASQEIYNAVKKAKKSGKKVVISGSPVDNVNALVESPPAKVLAPVNVCALLRSATLALSRASANVPEAMLEALSEVNPAPEPVKLLPAFENVLAPVHV